MSAARHLIFLREQASLTVGELSVFFEERRSLKWRKFWEKNQSD